jgi:hypothetical protein
MGHGTNKSHRITVRKDTTVTFNDDSDRSTEDLTVHADKMPPMDHKSQWSPLPVDHTNSATTVAAVGTRYSHEEDSIAMSDFNWRGHAPRSAGQF